MFDSFHLSHGKEKCRREMQRTLCPVSCPTTVLPHVHLVSSPILTPPLLEKPKCPFPNAIMLEVRVSTCEFAGS